MSGTNTLLLNVFAWVSLLSFVDAVFYHEPSHVEIRPSIEDFSYTTDFGFSLAYQNGAVPQLVVGAPHYDLVGKVYGCPLDRVLKDKQKCTNLNIDVRTLASNYDKKDVKQHFCLGGTISATKDYVFTCAPLWTTLVSHKMVKFPGSYGTCFVYYNQTSVHKFQGLLEQEREIDTPHYNNVYGGVGWSSLLEETNRQLLIGKPAVIGDIQYVSAASPLSATKSVAIGNKHLIFRNQNVGYALAFGHFFSNINASLYAFSFQDDYVFGKVGFLQYNHQKKTLDLVKYHDEVVVSPSTPVNMFGAALGACDVSGDDVTDLVVGAPAHTADETSYEAGAVYIYLGGDLATLTSLNNKGRITEYNMLIMSNKDACRFGTSIASSDIDGDGLSEVFVSAPYEDSGVGALYILSGFELKHIMTKSKTSDVYLSDLKHVQRIQKKEFKSYGYSLQVVSDVDENGCDELAVGAPGSASVDFLRCVPAINVSLSTRLINAVVKEFDRDFTVEVCVNVSYHAKPANITTKLSVVSKVLGNSAEIVKPTFYVPLDQRKEHHCENVVVNFIYNESGLYNFSAKLDSDIEKQLKLKDFDPGYVLLSVYSKTVESFEVTRYCSNEDDCTPRLQMKLLWAGSENVSEYTLGATTVENVTVLVENNGANVYDACVRVRISGARVLNVACGTDDTGGYKCYLPKPLPRDHKFPIKILVSMDEVTSDDTGFHIEAGLYNNCNFENVTLVQKDIKYRFTADHLKVTGNPHEFDVTETTILDKKNPTIDDRHKYNIVNSGPVHWKNIEVVVTMAKRDFVQNYTASTTAVNSKCTTNVGEEIKYKCVIDLLPRTTVSIIIAVEIINSKIIENLVDGQLQITSNVSVPLEPTSTVITVSQQTTITFVREITLKNNKTLIIIIAIIVAIIIMCVLMYILHRLGFFQRKQKQRLDSIKENMKSKNAKQSNSDNVKEGPKESKEEDDLDDFEIEVVDDCPFDPKPISTTSSNASLIDEKKTS